jgi:hypothetical protein
MMRAWAQIAKAEKATSYAAFLERYITIDRAQRGGDGPDDSRKSKAPDFSEALRRERGTSALPRLLAPILPR